MPPSENAWGFLTFSDAVIDERMNEQSSNRAKCGMTEIGKELSR